MSSAAQTNAHGVNLRYTHCPMPMIGPSQPCFIIADAGVNHGGSVDAALDLVSAAKRAGAAGVKFRVFKSERESLLPAAEQRRLELAPQDFVRIKRRCDDERVEFIAGVWDSQSLAELRQLGVRLLKLGSGEITNRLLIEACARSGLPLLLSTGVSTMSEITRAVGWHRTAFRGGLPAASEGFDIEGGGRLALLHTVLAMNPSPGDANLRAIGTIASRTMLPVGFSERSRDSGRAVLAVAAGACIVQKPLTLSRGQEGPNHALSLEPADFKLMVDALRAAEVALGDGRKRPMPDDQPVRIRIRRWLAAARALPRGHILVPDDLVALRPGNPAGGIGPYDRDWAVGRTLLQDVQAGEPLRREWLDGLDHQEASWFGTTPPREKPPQS